MSLKQYVLLGSSVVIAAAFGLAGFEAWWARERKIALADVVLKQFALDAEIQRGIERHAALEIEQAGLQQAWESLTKAKGPAALSPALPPGAPAAIPPNPLARIHGDPKVQAFWISARRAALAASHGVFFRAQNLAPEQVAKFQDIAIRREEQYMDLTAIKRAQGQASADSAIAALEQQAKATYETAMAELLGAAGVQALVGFERTLPVRNIVSGLAGVAAVAGDPLTASQAEALTQVLADASWRYVYDGKTDTATIDWAAVDAKARAILAEVQFTLFQTIEPEIGFNPYSLRFGSEVVKLIRRADPAAAGLPPVSAPATTP